MNSAASKPPSIPCTMERGLGSPATSSAAWCSSSASRLRMNQWLSFTSTRVAPAATAPRPDGSLHGRIGLRRHEAPEACVLRRAGRIGRVRLGLVDHAGDAFHVDGDVDAHAGSVVTLYYKVLDKRRAGSDLWAMTAPRPLHDRALDNLRYI